MKKILNIFVSPVTTLVLLFLLAAAIGTATFIEEKYDTATATIWVYNAWWFEAIMILLAVNFIGNIGRFKLYKKGKRASLLFHLAFILLIVGAGITRYIGFEGSMHIRQGASSNFIRSSKTYLRIHTNENGKEFAVDKELTISPYAKNDFSYTVATPSHGDVEISCIKFLKNAVEKVQENAADGKPLVELSFGTENGRETVLVGTGEVKDLGRLTMAFNRQENPDAVHITIRDGKLMMTAPVEISRSKMPELLTDTIEKNTPAELAPMTVYRLNGTLFSLVKFYPSAKRELVAGGPDENGNDALLVNVEYKGKNTEVALTGGNGMIAPYQDVNLGDFTLQLAYSNKPVELPFSLKLNEFILDRYAGSMSPSSYASEVTLFDPRNAHQQNHRIFMNNVLDYDGYRFFQSSYDMDEKGTILSVNHDFWGTWISYLGYALLALGFLFSMMSKSSRFKVLSRQIAESRNARKASLATVVLLLGMAFSLQAQTQVQKPISPEHADKLAHLLVQTFDGRFQPLHTLADDILHKLSRKDYFETQEKGKLNAMQVMVDMLVDGEYWKNQKIIMIREQSVRDLIGVQGKFASFNDFFSGPGQYKLHDVVEKAFRKKPAEQNRFDKELIKVDERVNICLMALQGDMLRIFPEPNSPNNRWVSPMDSVAYKPLTGPVKALKDILQIKDFNYVNLLRLYLAEAFNGASTGNYARAEEILGYLDGIQRQSTPENIIPTPKMVSVEIFYNKYEIFIFLRNLFGFLGLILLTLALVDNLKTKPNPVLTKALNVFIVILGLSFLYLTFGMGLRWYLTGHAPWSNGYETLILIAWGGLLAGFSFMKYSKITLAATVILAFSMLMTASHSSYDPQLTNLQPVLKSYWLIIHVAIITVSYGFLGLGFFLGLINMVLYLFKNKKNAARLNLVIKELTASNEMNLMIGVALATVGTFLGGVWASESWGRYWGWDAKESWALVIVIIYGFILHLRFVPKLKSSFVFNASSIVGFGSVIMTFVGVNYYLSKGLHSYAADESTVFPIWAWMMILAVVALITVAGLKEKKAKA